jgi:hypothetical protein
MLIQELAKTLPSAANTTCDRCQEPAALFIIGYSGPHTSDVNWCKDCALQVIRYLSEDLCELLTRGGRHG